MTDPIREALERIDRKAEAGLCYFTLDSARAFLKEIRDEVTKARAALAAQPAQAPERSAFDTLPDDYEVN